MRKQIDSVYSHSHSCSQKSQRVSSGANLPLTWRKTHLFCLFDLEMKCYKLKAKRSQVFLGVVLERYTETLGFTSVKRMRWSRTWEESKILRSEEKSWKTEINWRAEQRDWNKQTANRFGKDTKEGYCFAITRNTLLICYKSIQSTLATS